jgi:hypothetical protein
VLPLLLLLPLFVGVPLLLAESERLLLELLFLLLPLPPARDFEGEETRLSFPRPLIPLLLFL